MIWFYGLVGLLIYLFLIAPSFKKKSFYQRKYTHRGLHTENQTVKENSIEAFKHAIKRGYGIELDVQLSKEDEVVVYHDASLNRLESKDFQVRDLTVEQLGGYDIPSFKNVLNLVDNQVELIIELKSGRDNHLLCTKVVKLLKEYTGPYCVESFDPRIVAWFKKHAPDVMRGQLVQPIRYYDNKLVGFFINTLLYHVLTRPHFLALNVKSTRSNPSVLLNRMLGVKTCLWTVHKEDKKTMKWVDAYIFEYFRA